uniref:Uncharacterized protein LOC113787166 n=1 Tax=Cicer arietinum TaxID=3827 RepID=A0A3Q7XU24_CICAR|nr:uncharacterized protein LOC113787166 [Cicer arietinum]
MIPQLLFSRSRPNVAVVTVSDEFFRRTTTPAASYTSDRPNPSHVISNSLTRPHAPPVLPRVRSTRRPLPAGVTARPTAVHGAASSTALASAPCFHICPQFSVSSYGYTSSQFKQPLFSRFRRVFLQSVLTMASQSETKSIFTNSFSASEFPTV